MACSQRAHAGGAHCASPSSPPGATSPHKQGQAHPRETTPERALRKLVEQNKTLITEASRGEHERILTRHDDGAECPAAGGAP